jgi:Transcription factor WhiB.
VTWRKRAACRDTDPQWFDETAERWQQKAAVALCALCPVRADCEAEAIESGAVGMIWAGQMRHGPRPCLNGCGRVTDGSRYCSQECEDAVRAKKNLPATGAVCEVCGTSLVGKQLAYCGKACRDGAAEERRRARRAVA